MNGSHSSGSDDAANQPTGKGDQPGQWLHDTPTQPLPSGQALSTVAVASNIPKAGSEVRSFKSSRDAGLLFAGKLCRIVTKRISAELLVLCTF
jgi:hypothetical protein